MDKDKHTNYLSVWNGARLIECSSAYEKNGGSHVLIDNPRSLWLSESGLPQFLVFDISALKQKAKLYKCFGIDCWHDYESNPKVIELLVSLNGENFISWLKIQCELTAGTQIFDIDPISSSYSYLKIVVTETYGEDKCYLNRVFLLKDNPSRVQSMERSVSPIETKTLHNSTHIPRGSHDSKKVRMRKSYYSNKDGYEEIEPLTNDDRMMMMRFEKEFDAIRAKQIDLENELMKVKGQNKLLVDRVVFLEEAVDDKDDRIKELYKLINGMADQLGEIIRNEIAEGIDQSRSENQQLEHRIDNLEVGLREELEARYGDMMHIIRESQNRSVLMTDNKAPESTFRTKQKHIMGLMQRLQEKLALREMKVNQLKNEYGEEG